MMRGWVGVVLFQFFGDVLFVDEDVFVQCVEFGVVFVLGGFDNVKGYGVFVKVW